MIKFILRSIGYLIVAPFVATFALFFGIPALLALLIDYGFDDEGERDARLLSFTFIFAMIQFVILFMIASRVLAQ